MINAPLCRFFWLPQAFNPSLPLLRSAQVRHMPYRSQAMHWIALQAQPEAPAISAPTQPADVPRALAWWALQFTPKVACVGDAVVLDVTASARLWGGASALLRRLQKNRGPLGHLRLAQGETSLLALGRLRLGQISTPVADALPLSVLDAAHDHLETLWRMGCQQWGQLRALPRGGLVRRFGADLVQALDRAYGAAPDVYAWVSLPEVFEASLELSHPVEDASALLFGTRRLLSQLQAWLLVRQRAVLGLELRWFMDERRGVADQGSLVLRIRSPASDTAHLQRLLAEQLAHQSLPAPALSLSMRSLETVALSGRSQSLLPELALDGDSLVHMVERLSARLGPQRVLCWQPRADHRPQCMQAWLPALTQASHEGLLRAAPLRGQSLQELSLRTHLAGLDAAAWPSWLLAEPQALALHQGQPVYHGVLRLLSGAQRIEAAWWESLDGSQPGPVRRDYFVAHSEHAGLVWVFQESPRQAAATQKPGLSNWYLHGLFA